MNKLVAILNILLASTCFAESESLNTIQQGCNTNDIEVCMELGLEQEFSRDIQQIHLKTGGYFLRTKEQWSDTTLLLFQKYKNEYRKLFEECSRITSLDNMIFINMVNCTWRKDQILISKYDLDHLILDEAYERYQANFQYAKSTSIQFVNSRNRAALIDAFVLNTLHNDQDYFELMEIRVKRSTGK